MKIIIFFLLALWFVPSTAQTAPDESAQYEWYVPFCMVASSSLPKGNSVQSVNFKRNEWPCLFNLTDKEGTAKLTFFYEDGKTREKMVAMPAGKVMVLAFHSSEYLEFLGEHIPFGVRIESDVMILPQFSATEDGEKIREGLFRSVGFGKMAYPGPLSVKETKWVLPDGHISIGGKGEDRDWFVFLNPGEKPANLELLMVYQEKTVKKTLTVQPHSIMVYEPGTDPEFLESFINSKTYGLVVKSSEPIVMEGVRRFWNREEQTPLNSWQLIPIAVGDLDQSTIMY